MAAKQTVLLVLDGYGIAPLNMGNPRRLANTPTLEWLEKHAFLGSLQASGAAVGLPWGEAGNSEVGHMSIGTGRTVYQHLTRIVAAIRNGSFFSNLALREAFAHARDKGGAVHLMGLISSGSVHAYIDHVYALFEMAQRAGMPVYLHVFTDGRDAMPHEAVKFLPQVDERMKKMGVGRIATVCGRRFAMDRDGRWDRTEKTYRLLTEGKGARASSAEEAVQRAYDAEETDETVPPTVIQDAEGNDPPFVGANDSLIFFNFREDSARQITHAFAQKDFSEFERPSLQNFYFVTMTQYEEALPVAVAFPLEEAINTFAEVIAKEGLTQLRVAETEKYAHVTYFFNGGIEKPFPGEEHKLIPSSHEGEADEEPQMRAAAIAEVVVADMEEKKHDVVVANFANCDLVGHTGNFAACVKAVEAVDGALMRVLDVARAKDVTVFITADHGNVEEKVDLISGRKLTEHTTNPVPFFGVGTDITIPSDREFRFDPTETTGLLADVAPTILQYLGIPKPREMTGSSLL